MCVVIRAMSKIRQNVLPRTKDATAVEGHFKAKYRSGMQGNNRSGQSSSFRRTSANTNAVVADREKSDNPSEDYVFILSSLSQGNRNNLVT